MKAQDSGPSTIPNTEQVLNNHRPTDRHTPLESKPEIGCRIMAGELRGVTPYSVKGHLQLPIMVSRSPTSLGSE